MMHILLIPLNSQPNHALDLVNKVQDNRVVLVTRRLIIIGQPHFRRLDQQLNLLIQSHQFGKSLVFLLVTNKHYPRQRLQELVFGEDFLDKEGDGFPVDVVGVGVVEEQEEQLEGVLAFD